MIQPKTVESTINYFHVDGPRKVYPGTASYQRRKFESRSVQISDIRGTEADYKLDTNGFEIVKHEWPETKVDATDKEVKDSVYPETIEVVKQLYVFMCIAVQTFEIEQAADIRKGPAPRMSYHSRIRFDAIRSSSFWRWLMDWMISRC